MKSYKNKATDFDAAVTMARQSLVRFAAFSFLDPLSGAWRKLHGLRDDPMLHDAAALLRAHPGARPQAMGLCERSLDDLNPRRVLDRLPDSPQALNSEYERTFGLLVSGACPPYETEYVDSKFTFQRSNSLADISGFYQAFGLAISDQHPERPDHVVLELEFMAHLLGLERQAAVEDSDRRAEHLQVCRDAQARFLGEHLAWWTPAFAKLLGCANQNGFYAAAGVFLAALIPAERALLRLPPASRPVGPSVVERPELCEGCQLAD